MILDTKELIFLNNVLFFSIISAVHVTMLMLYLSTRLALYEGGINVWFTSLFPLTPSTVLELCFIFGTCEVPGPIQALEI